jgi:hypothetical protein
MGDEPITPKGWLPPAAPGGKPPPRFDTPRWQPPTQPAPAAQPQPRPPAAQPQPPVGERPVFVRPEPGPRNAAAVWALVLGITGLALLLLSFGTFFILTLPCSVGAWILGERARRRIARGETAQGHGQATAALWLGRIGVVAGVAAMVVFIVLLATNFDFERLRDDLQRELDRRRERQNDDGVRTGVDGLRAALGAWLCR